MKLLTNKEAAEKCAISPKFWLETVRKHGVPYVAFGKSARSWRYTESDVEALIEGLSGSISSLP